jgi:hypothetical protein
MNRSPWRTGLYASRKYGARKTSKREPVMPSTVSAMGRTAILLACSELVSRTAPGDAVQGMTEKKPYVFDIWAGLDGNHVTVLDPEVVANHSVDASAAVVEILISEDDEDSVTPLLSADENGISTEELKRLHGLLGQGNDGVVIVGSIGNPAGQMVSGGP